MSSKQYNPLLKKGFDLIDTTDDYDDDYLQVAGDSMEDDLRFPDEGIVMNSATKRWRVTMDTSGAFVSTEIV